jgi:DNA uptake protein ComE-like DNA-binding protein
VLIFTLWLTLGLAASALVFGHNAVLSYRTDANQRAVLACEQALDGAVHYLIVALEELGEPGALLSTEDLELEDLVIGDVHVWFLGRSDDRGATEPVFGLQDEAARLNLNTSPLEMLEELSGVSYEVAAAIVDWRDTDSEPNADGAESDTYLLFDPAYTAKDSDFEVIDELALLNGITATALQGRDRNRNTIVEDWEEALAEETGERFEDIPDLGLLDTTTVFSVEPNTGKDGQEKTDLNGQPASVSQALTDALGADRASAVTAAAPAAGTRFGSVLEFCIRAGVSEDEARKIEEVLTVSDDDVVKGRVNVLTAGREVLAAVPGIGEDGAEALVNHRLTQSGDLDGLLWIVDLIGQENAVAAGPYLTAATYRICADIVAVAPGARAFRRRRVVVDTRGDSPVVVASRDLTRLGWPLGTAVHESMTHTLPGGEE